MRTAIAFFVVINVVWIGVVRYVASIVTEPRSAVVIDKVELPVHAEDVAQTKSDPPAQVDDVAPANADPSDTVATAATKPEPGPPVPDQRPVARQAEQPRQVPKAPPAQPEASDSRHEVGLAMGADYSTPLATVASTGYGTLTPTSGSSSSQTGSPPPQGDAKDAPHSPREMQTVKVKRGNLCTKVDTNGTVKPEEAVEVFPQITGTVRSFAMDSSDPSRPLGFGSVVRKGDVLACLDAAVYRANVESSEASLARARADLKQFEARYALAQRERDRAERLKPDRAIAESEYEITKTNFLVAEATVDVGRAAVKQCEAALRIAQTNLDYTIIRSPIDGVIIARRAEIGQTVLANFPFGPGGVFLIAKDVQHLQVWATIKDADIGQIQADMPVHFTVDTQPGRAFEGKVAQLRLDATKNPNTATYAVAYTAIIDVDNPRGMLPYMTGSFKFEFDQRRNVLWVPNEALRESPPSPQNNPQDDKVVANSSSPAADSAAAPMESLTAAAGKTWRRILVRIGSAVRPIDVQIGASNKSQTEVVGDNVNEGMDVVLGEPPTADGA